MNTNNNIAIVIDQKDGQNVVSARELYIGLGLNVTNWKRWYKKNIINSIDFIEFEDYEGFVIRTSGNDVQDFIITLDMAKELTMLSRTAKGKEIRKYFIAKEKENQVLKLQLAEQNTKQIQKLTEGLKALQIETGLQSGYMTVKGYAKSINAKLERKDYPAIGKITSKICKRNGHEMGHIPHPEFGSVKTYPTNVLKNVFNSYLG